MEKMKKIIILVISVFSMLMLISCSGKNDVEEVDTVVESEQEIAKQEDAQEIQGALEETEKTDEAAVEQPEQIEPSVDEFEYRVTSMGDESCTIGFNMPEGWEESYKDTFSITDGAGQTQGYIQSIEFVNGENIINLNARYSDYFEDEYMGYETRYKMNFNLDGLDDAYEVKNVLEEMGSVDTPYGKAEVYLFKHMIKLSEEFQAIAEEIGLSGREMFEEKEAIEETDEGEFMVEAFEIALIRPQGIEGDKGIVVAYTINKGLEYQGFLEEFLPQMFE